MFTKVLKVFRKVEKHMFKQSKQVTGFDICLNQSKNKDEIATQISPLFKNFSDIATSTKEDLNTLKNREFVHEHKANDFTFNEINNCNNNHIQFFVKAGYDDVCVNGDNDDG